MKHCREVLKISVFPWADPTGAARPDPASRWSDSSAPGSAGSASADHHPAAPGGHHGRTEPGAVVSSVESPVRLLLVLTSLIVDCLFPVVPQGQQISVQGQQVAQTADGQTIVYQPVNADGTVLQQGKLNFCPPLFRVFLFHVLDLKISIISMCLQE